MVGNPKHFNRSTSRYNTIKYNACTCRYLRTVGNFVRLVAYLATLVCKITEGRYVEFDVWQDDLEEHASGQHLLRLRHFRRHFHRQLRVPLQFRLVFVPIESVRQDHTSRAVPGILLWEGGIQNQEEVRTYQSIEKCT